jgi:cytochrome c556
MRITIITLLVLGLFSTIPTYAESISNERINLFRAMSKNMKVISQADNVKMALSAAKTLNKIANKLSDSNFWPVNSGGGDTRARNEIWDNLADFNKKFETLKEATRNLVKIASLGDLKNTQNSFRKIGRTCGSCHRVYRSPKK